MPTMPPFGGNAPQMPPFPSFVPPTALFQMRSQSGGFMPPPPFPAPGFKLPSGIVLPPPPPQAFMQMNMAAPPTPAGIPFMPPPTELPPGFPAPPGIESGAMPLPWLSREERPMEAERNSEDSQDGDGDDESAALRAAAHRRARAYRERLGRREDGAGVDVIAERYDEARKSSPSRREALHMWKLMVDAPERLGASVRKDIVKSRPHTPSAELVKRREALIETHRQVSRREPPRPRTRTPVAARPRNPTPTPRRAAAQRTPTATLKSLVGDIPQLEDALQNGLKPRYLPDTRRTTPTPAAAAAAAPSSRNDTQDSPQFRRFATAEDYVQGIEDLYNRMRKSYMELQRNPEQFLRGSSPPPKPVVPPTLSSDSPRKPKLPATINFGDHQPSVQAVKLKDELAMLERQWLQLNSHRNPSASAAEGPQRAAVGATWSEGAPADASLTKTPDSKESVVQRVSALLSGVRRQSLSSQEADAISADSIRERIRQRKEMAVGDAAPH